MKRPSIRLLAADNSRENFDGSITNSFYTIFQQQEISRRHRESGNILYVDLHVDSKPHAELMGCGSGSNRSADGNYFWHDDYK